MNVLIAGTGRLGGRIAHVLVAGGNEVTAIDTDRPQLTALGQHSPQARTVLGDACEPAILEEAGALNADLLIAATGRDEDNLVISLLAKQQFAVPRVVARVSDQDNAWLFDREWGVDVAIQAATPLVSLIEEATGATDTVALLRLARAGVNLIETVLTEHSPAVGRRLSDITLPAGSIVAAVVRAGRPMVPDAGCRLKPGDELLIVSEDATEHDIHAAFQ